LTPKNFWCRYSRGGYLEQQLKTKNKFDTLANRYVDIMFLFVDLMEYIPGTYFETCNVAFKSSIDFFSGSAGAIQSP
jgi:hypothetical protein